MRSDKKRTRRGIIRDGEGKQGGGEKKAVRAEGEEEGKRRV